MLDIKISIVLFHTEEREVRQVLRLINKSTLRKRIFLIDNSADDTLRVLSTISNVTYIFNNANLGYGRGHNVAINNEDTPSRYHLVINSDIDFDPVSLQQAFDFMEQHDDVGMISPRILDAEGDLQYFCRKLPTPFDLLARRFIPGFFKPLFKHELDSYLLLNKDYSKPMNIPNLPGCFMFMRSDVLKNIGGFDENFFLYVEDIDLTRRLHEVSVTLYYPAITIKHYLAQGSYKFSKLVLYHIKSAIHYFNKWGWFADTSRDEINKVIGLSYKITKREEVAKVKELVFYDSVPRKLYSSR
ncbi:glycosyltransferase family 2 protein [uncultured Mucilaginibacter sp.]|uniref:glycosyltransferase n=1 Tax=uncultured Mucilaginibacter sp. TaxID=797541 RepID=UPI0025DB9272|nr:glycosyltransferase family 2 protein [uncultured Mucilaginibacter sp.]